jgi:outer membrane protein OmpA-like peptidoglycan-associated protein
MITFNTRFNSLLAGCLTIGTLVSGTVVADSRSTSTGYTSDSRGDIVRSSAGECVQTGSFNKSDATIVGCDDYVLDTKVTIIKGEGLDAVTMISFPQAELFAFDSDQMTDAGKAYIDGYRDELGNDLAQAYSVTVIGYTDSTGDADYNMGLSKRRADAVAAYMVSIGVPADKIRTLGRGENDPIASNDTNESRAQNRRVEAIIVGQPRALDAMIFPSVALFERRSAAITTQGEQLLQQNMQDAREQFKRSAYVEVVGHTDDVGDDAYNLDLSRQRAEAVGSYLVNAGVDSSKIIMLGAGESSPITSNATDEGRAENRRVEILLLGRTR